MFAALALSQRLPDDTVDERVFLTNLPLVKHYLKMRMGDYVTSMVL